jgi:hypothetical protein
VVNGRDENGKATRHPLALLRQINTAARGLSATKRLVLLGLAHYLDTRDFTARPSQATLAEDLELGVRTVGRALIKLCALKVLEVVSQGRGSRLENGARVGIVTTYRFVALAGDGYSATRLRTQ